MGLENYVKLKKLGQGSFGSVYLARDQRDGKQYVMKEIDVSALGQKARKEALREISFLSRLNHPSIIAYREWFEQTVTEGGTSRNTLDIVMEYADGGDLSQIIKGRKGRMLPEDQIVEYLVQVALAIKHIHDRKIIHRDIKSENIFLHDKFVKLGDFGISKSLANTLAQARTRIGTPYYLSPEICMDKPYDQKNDMWALGVVLYELCTLKHPFDSNSMEGLLHAIIHTKHKAISSMYSKDLRDLVDCLLQKNPKKRFSIHQLLKLPFIESQIGNFLSKHKAEEEFSHTILHSLRTVPEVPDGNPPMGLLRDSTKSGAGGAGGANMESISEEGAAGVGITGNRGGGRADKDGDANSGASPRTGRKDGGKENVNPQANGAGKTSSSSSSSVSAVEDATTSLESKKKMQQQYDNLQALINRKDLSPQELIRQYRLAAAETTRQQKEMALKQNAALLRAVGGMDSMDGGQSGSGVGGTGTSAVPGSNGGSDPAGNAVASSSTSNSGSSSSSNNNSTASTNNVVNVPASPTKAANSTSSSSSSSASSSSSSSAMQAPVQTSRMTTEKSSNNVASAGATSSSSCSSSVTGPKYPPTTGPSISSSSSSVASSSSSSSSNEKTAHAAAALLSPQAHHALQQKQQQQLLLQQHQQQQQEKQLLLQQQQQQLLAQLQQQRERQQRQKMSQQGGGGNPYGPTYNGGHMFDNAKAGGTSNSNSNNNAYRPPHAMLNNGGGGLNTNGMNGHYMHNGGGGSSGVNSGHSRNGPSHFASPTSAAYMPDMGRQGGGGGGSSRRDNGGGGGYGGHGGVQTRHGGPIPFNNMYDKPASLVPPSFPKLPTLGNIPGVNSGRYGNVQQSSAAAASSSSSHAGGGGGANPYAYVPHQMYQDAQKIQQKLLQQQQQQQQYQYEQQQQLLRHQQMMKQQHQRQHRGGGSSSNHMAHNLGPAHGAGQHRLAQQGHHHHGGGGGGGPAELYPSYAAYGQYPDPYGGGRPGMYIGGGHGGGGIAVGHGGGHGHGHHRQRQHGPNGIVAAAAREVGYETHVHHVGKASKGHKYHR